MAVPTVDSICSSPLLFFPFPFLSYFVVVSLILPSSAVLSQSPHFPRIQFASFFHPIQIIGTSAGPIVNTILFAELGNDWSQSQLRVVFTVGIFVGVPGYLLLSCFRDLKQSNQRQQQQLEEDQRPVRLIGSSPGKVMAPVGSIQGRFRILTVDMRPFFVLSSCCLCSDPASLSRHLLRPCCPDAGLAHMAFFGLQTLIFVGPKLTPICTV